MNNAVCYFFSYTIEAFLLWQYAANLCTPKYSKKVRLMLLCIFYLIAFTGSLLEIRWLNIILFFLVNFIFLLITCTIKWEITLFHSAILTALMSVSELVVYGIISHFTPNFFAKSDYFFRLFIFTIFSKLLYFFIIYILVYIFKKQHPLTPGQDKTAILLGFIPITSAFVMITFVSIGEITILTPFTNGMITLSAIFLLTINLLVFGINQHNQEKNLEFIEMQLLLQKESDFAEYYALLLEQNENQNILIHDIKKHLQSIEALNEKQESEKISSYIHKLLHSSELKGSMRMCDHEMLNAILTRYNRQCIDLHISFHVDIRNKTTSFISDEDLTALFCNLLDNAIDAAKNSENKYIELSIQRRLKTPFIVISVINTCLKDPFLEQNSHLTTTKSDKMRHGYGLKSIRKVVYKYHGDMQLYYNNESSTFHIIITLKDIKL